MPRRAWGARGAWGTWGACGAWGAWGAARQAQSATTCPTRRAGAAGEFIPDPDGTFQDVSVNYKDKWYMHVCTHA